MSRRSINRLILPMAFIGLSACVDPAAIRAQEDARAAAEAAAAVNSSGEQSSPVNASTSSGQSQQVLVLSCRPGRLCTPTKSTNRSVATTAPDASAYFETGRAQAENRQAQGRVADQRTLLNSGKPQTTPGQRASLANSRVTLQQQELRQQRERLSTAPFGHTVGSIYAQ